MLPTTSIFIIDPPERLDPPTDTSLALMRESVRRGHWVGYTTLDGLRLEMGEPWADLRQVGFEPERELFLPGAEQGFRLNQADILYMRKDPPVDEQYLHASYLLDRLSPQLVQVNPSQALRNCCEKLIPLQFPGMAPPTLLTRSRSQLLDFLQQQGKIVLKPLDDCSGRGIVALRQGDAGNRDAIDLATGNGKRFVLGQRFLPEIVEGDKRVLLLGGEILGWVRRLPATGEFRSNVNAGGSCVRCELTAADRAICERLKPWLQQQQIHLAGVDIVGTQVLEVNITSPSCLREMNALYGWSLERTILDYVENQLCNRRQKK